MTEVFVLYRVHPAGAEVSEPIAAFRYEENAIIYSKGYEYGTNDDWLKIKKLTFLDKKKP